MFCQSSLQSQIAPTNKLLAALPESEYQNLIPHLEWVSLSPGEILYEADEPIKYVYFPDRAMVSLIAIMEDGATTEIALIGNEGMIGIPVILGSDRTIYPAVVQIGGSAVKLSAEMLVKQFSSPKALRRLLLLYTQARLIQVSQNAACNRRHTIEERLATWLLTTQDCILSDELPLTHEYISNMLGTRRASVTVTAGIFQKAGMIRYTRGKITILDRQSLEETACECYQIIKNEFFRLLGGE